MNPSEFLGVLERLIDRLQRSRAKSVKKASERRHITSVVSAWFSQYKPSFLQLVGDEQLLVPMDDRLQSILKLSAKMRARITVIANVRSARKYFAETLLVPLSRAYWSRVPQQAPAGRDDEVCARLRKLDQPLADGYEQLVIDLEDASRLSYRGPAAELREVLTHVLHSLAPNNQVQVTEWYKEARRSGARTESNPTRAERVKFILRNK